MAAVKEKICKGGYVNLFSLYSKEIEPTPVQQGTIVIKEEEQFWHPKVARACTSWLSAFFIYATVLLKVQPAS